ncbi:MAG: ORF6C domain-containing protein [Anaerolineales bacterium]|nr:ORF6C domain-containing protein [Anaerolineales bacterium]
MSNELQVIEQREVLFEGDSVIAVAVQEDGERKIYIPVRQICDLLGVAWSPQLRRINRDAVLSQKTRFVTVTVTNSKGGNPNQVALPLEYLNGFLFGINASRVKKEVRKRLITYQEKAYAVLYEAFQEGRLTVDSTFDELLKTDSPSVQAYKMIMAMAQLAKQQVLLESRLDYHDTRFEAHENRLEAIESALSDTGRHITPAQASQVSQAVKAIALELSKQTKKNEYGGVYGELYRRFEITGYKLLPARRFDEAMAFLTQWYTDITGASNIPF